MAWDVEAKKLAIKVIGTVETNMKYDAINYRDPITVGIMQWYGTRAANLLNLMRATPAWVGVAASLHDDLVAMPEANGGFWTSRYLTRAEGDSLRGVLTSATGVQIQHAKTLSDLEDYKYQASRVNIDADTMTQQFIYFCMLYHQSPKYAREVVNSANANPSLDRLHTIAMNHKWYSGFKTRLTQSKTMILSGDTSGIPDFGTEGGTTPGTDEDEDDWSGPGDPSNPTQASGDIVSLSLVGNAIHVKLKTGTIICQPTNTNKTWLPGAQKTGPPIAPQTPITPDPDEPAPPTGGTPVIVPVSPNPSQVVTYKGHKFSAIMRDCVMSWEAACKAENIPFNISQGGYNPGGVAASAGSHDKDGIDLSNRDMTCAQIGRRIELGRERGLTASMRTTSVAKCGTRAQGFKSDHTHAVPNKWGYPSPTADRQADQYRNGTDGLKSRGPDIGPGHVSTYRTRTWSEFVTLNT